LPDRSPSHEKYFIVWRRQISNCADRLFTYKCRKEDWQLTVVDADINLAQSKIGVSPFGKAVSFDINDETDRKKFISEAHIVISLLPPTLHTTVAKSCIELNKNLLDRLLY
jgi:saccharopine dehydrogenase-like NADP-dependent oxidoreductase